MNSITSTAMKKSEIFDILVNKVCEVCEVREEIPDDMIPDLMHSIVRSVYEKGNLSLLGGRLKFNREQLESLKGIMKKHMPLEN